MDGIELTVHATKSVANNVARVCPNAKVHCFPVLPLPLRLALEQSAYPVLARYHDILWVPGNFAVFLCPRPQVLTAQNIWYFTDSAREFRVRSCSLKARMRFALQASLARASIRRAESIIAVSKTMQQAIELDMGSMSKLTTIVSAAPDLVTSPTVDYEPPFDRYVLAVSSDEPHKDWDGLFNCLLGQADLPPLAIAGAHKRKLTVASSRIALLGPVECRARLSLLYRNASCVIAHSHLESFGLTACEAMAAGTPLAASDIPAHREICGDRAFFYDPKCPAEMANAVRQAINLRQPKTSRTDHNKRSWDDCGRELLSEFERVVRPSKHQCEF